MPNLQKYKVYCKKYLPKAYDAIYAMDSKRTLILRELYESFIFLWIQQQEDRDNIACVDCFFSTQATLGDLEIFRDFQFSEILDTKQQGQLVQYVLNKDNRTDEKHLDYNILRSCCNWDEGLTSDSINNIFSVLNLLNSKDKRALLQSLNMTDSMAEINEIIEKHINAHEGSSRQESSSRLSTLFDHKVTLKDEGEAVSPSTSQLAP